MSKLLEQMNTATKKIIKLSDVAFVVPGFAFKSVDFNDNGIPLVKITEIQSPYVVLDKCSRVDASKYQKEKIEKFYLKKGEHVVAMTGATIGKVGEIITDELLLLNQRVAVVRPKPEACREYIESQLSSASFQSYIKSIAGGSSAQANISGDDIGDFKFSLPDLPIQKKIAEISSAYDEKIENNNKIIKNLEIIARTIFNEWFVNFRFLGYKKTKIVETEIGKIPEGWEIGNLSKIADINPSTTIDTKVSPYVEMRDLSESGMYFRFEQKRQPTNGSRFKNHDTLVARITPCLENGKTGYVDCLEDNQVGSGSTEFIVLRPKSDYFKEFIYLLARSTQFRNFAIGRMVGSSGRQRVSADDLDRYKIILPNLLVIQSFHKIIFPNFEKIKTLSEENTKLKESRDRLLMKLI